MFILKKLANLFGFAKVLVPQETIADMKQFAQQTQQPAKTTQKRKPKVAQSTTQVKSRKQETTTAKTKPIQRGKQQVTPAPQTPRHVKQAPKRKP